MYVVLTSSCEANAGTRAAIKPREIFFGECARELTRAVCAIVEKYHAIAVFDCRYGSFVFADYHYGFYEFIRHAFCVRFAYRLNRVDDAARPSPYRSRRYAFSVRSHRLSRSIA